MNDPSSPQPANSSRTLAIDGALGVTLLVVLGAVYGLDRQAPPRLPPEDANAPKLVQKTVEEDTPPQVQEKPLRLAVTRAHYDDMGKLLQTLGSGYQFTTIELDELLDKTKVEQFDVIFLTCAPLPRAWAEEVAGEASRPGTFSGTIKPEITERVRNNLQQFVTRGGTLYASDWMFGILHWVFPDLVDPTRLSPGKVQTVTAEAVDPGLKNLIGGQIPLKFDMAGWYPAALKGQSINVLLQGRIESLTGEQIDVPLLVKFPVDEGTVIFSSFHNEKQNSELELKLLRYLVFATVLAKTEAKITKTLAQGQFSPAARNLLSATTGSPSVTQVHHCDKAGPLRFVLGFENRGALLQLSVVGPSGKKLQQEGTSTFTIDVPDAEVGDWKSTITALKVPHENFPFTLTIGKK